MISQGSDGVQALSMNSQAAYLRGMAHLATQGNDARNIERRIPRTINGVRYVSAKG